jgi:hypothetical protein
VCEQIILDRTQHPVTPTTYAIRSLPDNRDRLPEGKQIYEMVRLDTPPPRRHQHALASCGV